MAKRACTLSVALAVATGLLAVVASQVLDLPLRDPDSVLGPSFLRLPLIVLLFFLADVAPRAVAAARGLRGAWSQAKAIAAERWTRERLVLVGVGLGTFYVTYVAYRNLKSFLPWIREHAYDDALLAFDRVLLAGHEPATLLHRVLGTGASADLLAVVYLSYLAFVPASLAAWLVWSRNVAGGLWYSTALCLNWALGVLSYYAVPSMGPIFAAPSLFHDLPYTAVTRLQDSLNWSRYDVINNPHATEAVQSIAGFASLHVSVVFTAALVTHLTVQRAWIRWAMWAYLVATVVSTVYFGWHYVSDDVAGLAIGALAVWLAAWATGHDLSTRHRGKVFGHRHRRPAPQPKAPERAPLPV